ncbi:MAG: YceI family protein [Pseudomonadota bacterium]|uniref:YceI family protein n=1 Tax=Sphingomonas sp. ERG5 TaxID=1381597 RepID=UPI00054C1BE4|nr:YceI family protein [Sphingomonas sp. ERG5]
MRLILTAALTLASAPVLAQQLPTEAPGKLDTKQVVAGTYALDPAHSQVLFTVNHLGFTEYTGQFTSPSGTLTLDPAHPEAAKVSVTFPVAKVRTTVEALDKHLQGAEFFDAAKFPTITFVSTSVATEGTNATISGNLTIKGVTKPVVLKARLIGAGKAFWGGKKTNVGFAATTAINRSDFGMGYSVPLVSDRIDLTINAGFEAQ